MVQEMRLVGSFTLPVPALADKIKNRVGRVEQPKGLERLDVRRRQHPTPRHDNFPGQVTLCDRFQRLARL